jgi:hypothetical protein
MRNFFFLSLLIFPISFAACGKKSEKNQECNKSKPLIQKKIVKVPKYFYSRTLLELQLRILRSFKIEAWDKMNYFLLGGALKDSCPFKSTKMDWKSCFGKMHKQSISLLKKTTLHCPSKVPQRLNLKSCKITNYCQEMVYTIGNKDGEQREIRLKDIVKIVGKWWVMGHVSCKTVTGVKP